jgi:hypothetical protein
MIGVVVSMGPRTRTLLHLRSRVAASIGLATGVATTSLACTPRDSDDGLQASEWLPGRYVVTGVAAPGGFHTLRVLLYAGGTGAFVGVADCDESSQVHRTVEWIEDEITGDVSITPSDPEDAALFPGLMFSELVIEPSECSSIQGKFLSPDGAESPTRLVQSQACLIPYTGPPMEETVCFSYQCDYSKQRPDCAE